MIDRNLEHLPRGLAQRVIETPVGEMLAVAGPSGLALLEFHDRRALPTEIARLARGVPPEVDDARASHHLDATEAQLGAYFRGERVTFDVALTLAGTEFERRVWARLMEIPSGRTLSYAKLAAELGLENGQRAVGRANGANCIAIVIPCHRVICSDGSLGGYGGKLWRKEWLLDHEARMAGKPVRAKQSELAFV